MMRRLGILFLFAGGLLQLQAQQKDSIQPRPITAAEYAKAKPFTIKDLDNDSYVKVENTYILDRYEKRKPFFITGDDGLKKRIDLYRLVAKDGLQELGTTIYYTNEKGKVYTALQPNFTADGKVWEQYFEDIHSIDKEEKNFVLKLSYILSREMSYQLYKAINKGKDVSEQSATYGTDICFPGDQWVAMANGSRKQLVNIRPGDKVLTKDLVSKKEVPATVTRLVKHKAENYAVTRLLVVSVREKVTPNMVEILLSSKALSATPNHPIWIAGKKKKMSEVVIGDEIICSDKAKTYAKYRVLNTIETTSGVQNVYNMEVNLGSTFIMNGIMVMQK